MIRVRGGHYIRWRSRGCAKPGNACVLGSKKGLFGAKNGRFGAQNRLNLTKFDHGFEVDLLIMNGLSAIFAPKKEIFFL
jgi:hypothetical protein